MSNGQIVEPQISERATKLTQRRHGGKHLCHLAKRAVSQIEPPAFEPRPWNAGLSEPSLEAFELEGASFKDVISGVNAPDQLVLYRRPTLPQLIKHGHVDRNARIFNSGGGGHVPAPQERPW